MKLVLFGYGRMGQAVEEIALDRGHEVSLTLDEFSNEGGAGITAEALGSAEMAIDFSVSSAVRQNVSRATQHGVSVVVGTTGWEAERGAIGRLVKDTNCGLLCAPNFSVGMLLFSRIVQSTASLMNRVDEYDAHLWEAHHRHKADHPGGTARKLADLLVEGLDRKTGWTTELPAGAPIDQGQLQVAVTRVGSVPGVHGVGFEGPDDRIELRHEARSRRGFARGAVYAAEWLRGRSGVFTMSDVMDDLLGGVSHRSVSADSADGATETQG